MRPGLASSPGIFSWHCIDLVYDKLNSADAIEASLDLLILLVVSAFIRSNIGPKFRAEITHNLIIASRAKTGSHQITSTLGKDRILQMLSLRCLAFDLFSSLFFDF